MGNTAEQETIPNTFKTYNALINRDFNEEKSVEAALKYPNDLQKAIDFILASNKKHINNDNNCNDDENKHDDYNKNIIKMCHHPRFNNIEQHVIDTMGNANQQNTQQVEGKDDNDDIQQHVVDTIKGKSKPKHNIMKASNVDGDNVVGQHVMDTMNHHWKCIHCSQMNNVAIHACIKCKKSQSNEPQQDRELYVDVAQHVNKQNLNSLEAEQQMNDSAIPNQSNHETNEPCIEAFVCVAFAGWASIFAGLFALLEVGLNSVSYICWGLGVFLLLIAIGLAKHDSQGYREKCMRNTGIVCCLPCICCIIYRRDC